MGFVIKPLPKNKKRAWKLQISETDEKGNRTRKDVKEEALGQYQFSRSMSLEEARRRASDFNKVTELKRYADLRVRVAAETEKKHAAAAASVPDEAAFFKYLEISHRIRPNRSNKFKSHWLAAMLLIQELGIKPPDYAEEKNRIYAYFEDRKLSVGYLQKVLRPLNLYGRFYAKTYKVYFEPVKFPRGLDRERINDAHFSKEKRRRPALPLTPKLLYGKMLAFPTSQYNWIYLSLFCGLRPLEVDNLKNPDMTKLTKDESGTDILHVYQSKLTGIERDLRWKLIPLFMPEQKCIPEMIRSGDFNRPIAKTMGVKFGEGFTLYSGRKGFERMLTDAGQPFEYVSAMLGHQSLDMTWKKYRNRKVARYKKGA